MRRRRAVGLLAAVAALMLLTVAAAQAGGQNPGEPADPLFPTRVGPGPEPRLAPAHPPEWQGGGVPAPGGGPDPAWNWRRLPGLPLLWFALGFPLGLLIALGQVPLGVRIWATRAGALGDRVWDWLNRFAWFRALVRGIRDFLAGAAIEYFDAVGLGLLRLSLRERGIDPDAGASPAYEAGRFVGGMVAAFQGIWEMLIALVLIAGGGGGGMALALPSGGTSVVSGMAAAVIGVGGVIHGPLVAAKGVTGSADALSRIVGRWREYLAGEQLLTEEEVRKLLGPKASEEAVQRFMRFQEYAAQVMGRNLDRGRVRGLLQKHGGLGAVLREWVAEIGPERAQALVQRYADRPHVLEAILDAGTIFDKYTGRRQALGAITEHRLAMKLAEERDLMWMKVVEHTNHPGADIYFVERVVVDGRVEFRVGIADAKGSLGGTSIQGSSAFSGPQIEGTMRRLREELRSASLKNQITPEQYPLFAAAAENPTLIIGVGGTGGISDAAISSIRQALMEKRIQSPVEVIWLDP